jgi:sugar phosphate isomerase/epimerase
MKLAAKTEPNEKKLVDIQEAGFWNVEIYTDKNIIEDPASIDLLNSFTFNYVVHAPWNYIDNGVVDFALGIGVETINTHKIVDNDVLAKVVEYARERNITITIENEAYPESHHLDDDGNPLRTLKSLDPIRSGGDFIRLQELIPNIRLCIDIEHALIRREYPTIIRACAQHLKHVHLCGYTGGKHHQPVYENVNLVKEVAAILKDCNYSGFVVCEHDVDYHTPEVWKRTLEECAPLFGEQHDRLCSS